MHHPIVRPDEVATRVARARSPVRSQTSACRMRPPSSGAPGATLNAARIPLTSPSQALAATRTAGAPTPSSKLARPTNATVTATLVAGPATAMANSSRGRSAVVWSSATPPNSHRVMRSTGTPRRWATTEWATSWARSEAKKHTVATTATIQKEVAG